MKNFKRKFTVMFAGTTLLMGGHALACELDAICVPNTSDWSLTVPVAQWSQNGTIASLVFNDGSNRSATAGQTIVAPEGATSVVVTYTGYPGDVDTYTRPEGCVTATTTTTVAPPATTTPASVATAPPPVPATTTPVTTDTTPVTTDTTPAATTTTVASQTPAPSTTTPPTGTTTKLPATGPSGIAIFAIISMMVLAAGVGLWSLYGYIRPRREVKV